MMQPTTTIDREKFAGAIRAHCHGKTNLTEFARLMKLSPATLCRAANGVRLPSADNFMTICLYMDRQAEDFLGDKPENVQCSSCGKTCRALPGSHCLRTASTPGLYTCEGRMVAVEDVDP